MCNQRQAKGLVWTMGEGGGRTQPCWGEVSLESRTGSRSLRQQGKGKKRRQRSDDRRKKSRRKKESQSGRGRNISKRINKAGS